MISLKNTVIKLAKRIKREESLAYLQSEVQTHAKNAGQLRQENEQLRNDRMMLIEIITDMVEDDSYWVEGTETQTMRWRVKNLVNNIKNG